MRGFDILPPSTSHPTDRRAALRLLMIALTGIAAFLLFGEAIVGGFLVLLLAFRTPEIRAWVLVTWLVACLLPWPGSAGLVRRMICVTAVYLAAPMVGIVWMWALQGWPVR